MLECWDAFWECHFEVPVRCYFYDLFGPGQGSAREKSDVSVIVPHWMVPVHVPGPDDKVVLCVIDVTFVIFQKALENGGGV